SHRLGQHRRRPGRGDRPARTRSCRGRGVRDRRRQDPYGLVLLSRAAGARKKHAPARFSRDAPVLRCRYLTRLNDPTPWTTRMMPYYRGMTRGLCTVLGSFGLGLGSAHLLQAAQAAMMTNEQRIRGADRAFHSAIILAGYDDGAV